MMMGINKIWIFVNVLDIRECFVAMEQYCKKISTHNLNSAFAGHLESRVVTINRLMKVSRAVLLQLSLLLKHGGC